MRINNGEFVSVLEPGMNLRFMDGARELPTQWQRLADLISSNQVTETYPWLGNTPMMERFGVERKRRKFVDYSFSITNEPYESTIAIKRQLIVTDQIGKIEAQARNFGRMFPKFLEKGVFDLLNDAATATAYDGQNYVDTDHSEGSSGTQSNKGTTALSTASFAAARAVGFGLKDDQGNPAGINYNLLVVPGGLATAADEILVATVVNGTTNVQQGKTDVLVSGYLTDTNNWFLIDTTGEKPFIVQELEELELGFQGKDSYVGWNRAEYEYGAYWDGAFGYADWRKVFGAIVA